MNGKTKCLSVVAGSLLVVGLGTFASPRWTLAADYPEKPLRLVVAFPPGGAIDILARGLAPKLGEQLGQQIIVENRPGANGVIAFDLVAKASADGYTLLIGYTSGMAINPLLVSKIPYDPVKDFAPIGMIARTPAMLVANPSFPANSVKELIALAKAAPGKITYGSPGIGNFNHLAGEMLKSMAGVDLVHVPYKGAALVITDLIGGHVAIAFTTLPSALPHVRTGKLKALAITSDKRWGTVPGVPTMSEAGLPGLEIGEWFGLLSPARTPRAVISRLNEEIVKAVRSPEVHGRFIEQGFEPITTTTDQFAAVINSDIVK